MSSAMTVTISSANTTNPPGTVGIGTITLTGTLSPPFIYTVALASGNNVITVPTGAIGCIITPSGSNPNALTLKGATVGDAGHSIPKTTPTLVMWDSAVVPATLNLLAASSGSGNCQFCFF